ncbi:MAG: ABC transporter permease [Candidatus Rokuibacteriota bacterium]|nr:MAG: ABC transporter permease [Candidatus Rokubacteria bacterium]PYN99760.1 MAG: ABC transporter permease [Candidatus Rokubacteria bacterium]
MSHIASGAPGDLTAPSRAAADHAALAGTLIPPPPPAWRRLARRLLHLWLLALFLVVWQAVSTLGTRINPQLDVMLPPPTAVFSAAQELIARGALLTHVMDSLRRVLVAVGVGAILGVPLGLAMGWSAGFRASVDPLLEFIRPIPPLAWIPLSILWFGIGDTQNEYIIFLAAFFPIVLNAMAGARDVDTYLVRAGLSLGARRRDLFLTVVLPASLPNIFTGLRVGLGIGWMALVAGELVAAPTGLGFMINNARTLFRSDYILLGMVLIGILGLILDFLMRQIAAIAMPWYRR